MEARKWPPDGVFVRVGGREVSEYRRGKTYYVRVKCFFEDGDGNLFSRWSPSRTVNGRKADAEIAAERYRRELERALGSASSVRDVAMWADEFQGWRMGEAGRPDTALLVQTVERNALEVRRVKEYYGGYEFPGITSGQVIDGLRRMRKDGMSDSAVNKVRQLLSQVFDYAIGELCRDDASLYLMNPCSLKTVKRESRRPKSKPQEALTEAEAVGLAKWIREHELTGYTVAVYIALATGMRRGEVLGLSWSDVDLEEAVVYVRKQWAKDKELRDPKTDESVGAVVIDEWTVDFLRYWREQQRAEFEAKGTRQVSASPVCHNKLCNRIDPDNFNRWRRRFYVERGLGEFTEERVYVAKDGRKRVKYSGYRGKNLHTLRHTQSTLLIGEGEDLKTVQGRLRHAEGTLTLNTYTHTIKENDRKAAKTIGRILQGGVDGVPESGESEDGEC